MIDRAIAIVGLALVLILGLYVFAPEGWPKVPPLLILSGMGLGFLLLGFGAGLFVANWRNENRADFAIEFDPADPRFVDIGADRIRYSVGLRIRSAYTIVLPSVRALNTEFTNQIFTEVDPYNWGAPTGAMFIYVGGALDPHALELFLLFELPINGPFLHADLLARHHRFTLEARGRNAKTLSVDFEYDPSRFPRIRKC